jgi:5'-deoxynucleotidase YfbR-like HD superfamily hydrolase
MTPASDSPLDEAARRRLEANAPRTWQRMLSGRRLNLIEPSPLDVEIHDIALGLARNTRWNGQTSGEHGWSVAQHSLFVVEIMQRQHPETPSWVLLAGLLHDAPEYVTHDLITPLKAAVGDVFREIEARLAAAIHLAFGLPPKLPREIKARIKQADLVAGATEAVQLAGFAPDEVKSILSIPAKPFPGAVLRPLPSALAQAEYLRRFDLLHRAHRHALAQGNGAAAAPSAADAPPDEFRF